MWWKQAAKPKSILPFGCGRKAMDVASPWNEEYPPQMDLQSFPFPLLSAASKDLNRWCPVSQKKSRSQGFQAVPTDPWGPKHHVCRHRSSWGTSISAWFWMGKPPKIHKKKQASPSNMTQSPGWRLHWTTYICIFFLKIWSPYSGDQNITRLILSRSYFEGLPSQSFF